LAVLGTVLVSNTNAANLEETNAPLKSTIIVPNPLMMVNNPNLLNAHVTEVVWVMADTAVPMEAMDMVDVLMALESEEQTLKNFSIC